MTMLLLDVAIYQGSLRTEDVKRAGFAAVNLKVSHGLSRKSVHPDLAGWVDRSRAAGLGISTFHYFTADAAGADQAEYAYARIAELGLAVGTAHQLDVECSPAPQLAEVRAYIYRMSQLLGRPIALYTGDWWWRPKGWTVAPIAPYLWAAPNTGYLGAYPGDTSPHWMAAYSGWQELAVMQYAVQPLTFPGGTRGTIDVSKSAIRDPAVWRALTGEVKMATWVLVPALGSLRGEFNAISPSRDKASDGSVGDEAHSFNVSDHNPDETGNTGSSSDSDSINEVHAIDVDITGPWPAGWSMERFVQIILTRCRSGAEKRLKYIIFNKRIWTAANDWKQELYGGSNPHDKHAHFSAKYGSGSGDANPENITAPWGMLAAITAEQEDDMPTAKEVADEVTKQMTAMFASRAQTDGSPTSLIGQRALDQGIPDGTKAGAPRDMAWAVLRNLGVAAVRLQATADAILKNVVADDGDAARIVAEIQRQAEELENMVAGVPLEVLDALGGGSGSDEEVAAALRAALGDRARSVGARLAA